MNESPANIRMNRFGVNFATIRSDGRYLNEFEMNQADHFAWTPNGRGVFVWLEHTSVMQLKLRENVMMDNGFPFLIDIHMVAVKLKE